jgi:putative aminopeptidase FrvX
MGALELFRALTSVPTAPFYEAAVTAKALAWIKKNLPGAKVSRKRGGVIVRYVGNPGAPALALAAHLDHPAFHLKDVNAERATAILKGGLPPHLLNNVPVEAFTANPKDNVPAATGMLEKLGDDYRIKWNKPPKKKPAFAILALTPFETKDGWLESRSIDDLLGCAASLEAMRLAMKARLKTNVTVLLHRAEEVGFVGALDLIHEGAVSKDDTILSIEASRAMEGAAETGKGPVIRLGDKACAFDPNATELLDAAAKGLTTQRYRLMGGTCEATAYLAFGYEAGGAAVPLLNYHNGWGAEAVAAEKVRLSDLEGMVSLLFNAAKLFPERALRGVVRRRLSERLKSARIAL